MNYLERNGFKNYPYIRMKIVIPCINVGIQFFSKYTNWSKVDYYYVNEHIAGIYKDHLDWSKVLYYLLNDEFLIDHEKYIPFFDSKIYQSFSRTQFRIFKDYIDWSIISYDGVSEEFLSEFKDYIDWSRIDYNYLSEEFLREFKDYIDWSKIAYDDVSEDFLREFKDYVDWNRLYYDLLSEEFLREFKDYIDWSRSTSFVVSPAFYRDFQDYIDWERMSECNLFKDKLINPPLLKYPIIEHHNDVCGICRDQEGSMIQLPCNHVFHSECISSWIERSRSCPMCRHPL